MPIYPRFPTNTIKCTQVLQRPQITVSTVDTFKAILTASSPLKTPRAQTTANDPPHTHLPPRYHRWLRLCVLIHRHVWIAWLHVGTQLRWHGQVLQLPLKVVHDLTHLQVLRRADEVVENVP